MIIDTHVHFDDEAYDEDREEFLAGLQDKNIHRVVNIGADISSSLASIELANRLEYVYAVVGVHPSNLENLEQDYIEHLKTMSMNDKVVAIGEIGLDYYWDEVDRSLQKEHFIKQLELAREVKLPVVIHSRDAAKDTYNIMNTRNAGSIGGVMHCYSYSVDMARDFLNMGFFFGIGGVVTFKNARKLKEVVEYLPLSSIVLETDSPYLAPVPYRGKRNSSEYLSYVIREIAKIKNISGEEVITKTYENAYKLYTRLR